MPCLHAGKCHVCGFYYFHQFYYYFHHNLFKTKKHAECLVTFHVPLFVFILLFFHFCIGEGERGFLFQVLQTPFCLPTGIEVGDKRRQERKRKGDVRNDPSLTCLVIIITPLKIDALSACLQFKGRGRWEEMVYLVPMPPPCSFFFSFSLGPPFWDFIGGVFFRGIFMPSPTHQPNALSSVFFSDFHFFFRTREVERDFHEVRREERRPFRSYTYRLVCLSFHSTHALSACPPAKLTDHPRKTKCFLSYHAVWDIFLFFQLVRAFSISQPPKHAMHGFSFDRRKVDSIFFR